VSGCGIHWAIFKSAPCSRQIGLTMPAPHHSVFIGRMPFLPPSQQCQSVLHLTDSLRIEVSYKNVLYKSTIITGSKKPILFSLLGSRKGFSVISARNLNIFGWHLEYKCGTTMHTSIKNFREIAPGVPQNGAKKMFCFFRSPIQHGISRADFDHVWNNRRESVSWSIHPWEISELRRVFTNSP